MRIPVRALTRTLALAALLAMLPAAGFADGEATAPEAAITVEATNATPDLIATPAPALPPAGLDEAIPTSGSLGDCWVKCATIDPYWIYGVTYEYCCGQGHSCPDGSTGYARGFWPYVGTAVRCTL